MFNVLMFYNQRFYFTSHIMRMFSIYDACVHRMPISWFYFLFSENIQDTYLPKAKHSSLTVAPWATWTTSGNCTSIFGSYSPITPEERNTHWKKNHFTCAYWNVGLRVSLLMQILRCDTLIATYVFGCAFDVCHPYYFRIFERSLYLDILWTGVMCRDCTRLKLSLIAARLWEREFK